jgi:hypothetical protein
MNWQQKPRCSNSGVVSSFHHPAHCQRGTLNMRNVIEKSAVYNDFVIAGPAGLQ